MKRIVSLLAAVSLFAAPTVFAAEVVRGDTFNMNVTGRLQLLGHLQSLDDSVRDDLRAFMYLRQARLGVNGDVAGFKYTMNLAFGGEDEVKAPSPGITLGLLDMYVDAPLKFVNENTWIRAGQFKVPYSLERLTDSGVVAFEDRSLNNLAFRIGRDYGVAAMTDVAGFKAAAGLFSGGGRNVPERYIPLVLGVPMVNARLGYDNGLYENAFAEPKAYDGGTDFAVYGNVAYMQDSQIGHSTVLSVRLGERPLYTNTNYNPFLSQKPVERGDILQAGFDAAVRFAAGPGVFNSQLEFNYGRYQNTYGEVGMIGGRAQVGYTWNSLELAARYAIVQPDADMTVGGALVTGAKRFHEVTPAATWWFSKGTRIVADLPIMMDVPVVTETGVGSYVLTDQPDQASLLRPGAAGVPAAGTVARQNVVNARLMFQATF